ncbi:MAG: hypothetical protein QOI03_1862 [Solirubrobacteraceae bacterium]|nr:hypothetical protein [Solirubrobacteraceae bacterium]
MSGAPVSADLDRWAWLPAPLRPRAGEHPGSGRTRLIETTLLVLAGMLLALATINDVVRQTHTNQRLIADLRTWRSYTGHPYHNLSIEQELFGINSHREVVCGNTSPGGPKARVQLCLAIAGPPRGPLRTVQGGWYLPPRSEDFRADRYACFGPAARGMCGR